VTDPVPKLAADAGRDGAEAKRSIEDVCRIAYRVADRGGHLDEVLRELVAFGIDGREAAVVEAEGRCWLRAADDTRWARAATLLQHAVETGLFRGQHPGHRSADSGISSRP
jgi:hypothetical protein